MQKIRFKHVFIFLIAIFSLWRGTNAALEFKKERDLAQRLGIDIDAYPHISRFPKSYFLIVLKPDMTRKEVHEIVKEYEQVLHCRRSSEIYYYYSKNDAKALRFKVVYDFDGRYVKLMGEDDSTMLVDEGCAPGLLDE